MPSSTNTWQFTPSAGLRGIAELPKLTRRILVYGGTRSLKTSDGVDVWSFQRFFEALQTNQIWG